MGADGSLARRCRPQGVHGLARRGGRGKGASGGGGGLHSAALARMQAAPAAVSDLEGRGLYYCGEPPGGRTGAECDPLRPQGARESAERGGRGETAEGAEGGLAFRSLGEDASRTRPRSVTLSRDKAYCGEPPGGRTGAEGAPCRPQGGGRARSGGGGGRWTGAPHGGRTGAESEPCRP